MHPSSLIALKQVALKEQSDPSPTRTTRRDIDFCMDDLCDQGLVCRTESGYALTRAGYDALRSEENDYRLLFGGDALELDGTVTSGLGEGEHFTRLEGYHEQFCERLGYEPFPGTFNVSLREESIARRDRLRMFETVQIDGWDDEDRTFGPARCHPAYVRNRNGTERQPSHVIIPARTDHDESQIELLASVELRSALNVDDGDLVTISIWDE